MPYTLGIDLGTSKVAIVAMDAETGAPAATAACPANADVPCPAPRAEQDPGRILDAVDPCMQDIPEDTREQVVAIGITGQMHGVLLCSADYRTTTSLITWQDNRCNEDGFLDRLKEKTGVASIRSGYGCASLAWLAEYEPGSLQNFDHAAAIQDYFVARICGLAKPVTDPTNAAAWGLYDTVASSWTSDQVEAAGIPAELLPEIRPSSSVAGKLQQEHAQRWKIPSNTPVITAIGDNQASLVATLQEPQTDIALTLGTGGQLSVMVNRIEDVPVSDTVELRPYVDGKYLAVAASLCGGRAVNWLVDSVVGWCRELEIEPPERDELFRRLDRLALENPESSLQVCSSFQGERADPSVRGEIRSIDIENFTLGNLSAALAQSVVQNLHDMMPPALLQNRRKVIGSGNGLRLKGMQAAVEKVFGLPLEIAGECEEAALGAARLAAGIVG
ncbi:MAG: hypothetical protein HQ559_04395, partial [Lentisphaerae bacterium]|nr:hypothetical protein [Lentisphaerota bacterium]